MAVVIPTARILALVCYMVSKYTPHTRDLSLVLFRLQDTVHRIKDDLDHLEGSFCDRLLYDWILIKH